jgi:hypothetical protein
MVLGLSREEIEQLALFGKTRGEAVVNLYGAPPSDLGELFDKARASFERKMVELVLKNNERIAKQLLDAGVHLPE